MAALIDKLFPEAEANAIRKLWEDKNSRLLIQQEIGKTLISQENIIEELPLTQIMFITSLSPFASSEKECYNVASIIYWGISKDNILPYITDQQETKELAYKCFISLGMFKQALVRRWERHGAPSPRFYREVGIKSFRLIGMHDIGDHFMQWESFMSEMFI